MLKSLSIHQGNNKGIVKFNFVILCLTFRGSIATTYVFDLEFKNVSCLGLF